VIDKGRGFSRSASAIPKIDVLCPSQIVSLPKSIREFVGQVAPFLRISNCARRRRDRQHRAPVGRPIDGHSKSTLGTIRMLREIELDHLGKLGCRLQFLAGQEGAGRNRRSRRFQKHLSSYMIGLGRNDLLRSQNLRCGRSDFRCSLRSSKCKYVLRRSDEAVVTRIVTTGILVRYIHFSNHTVPLSLAGLRNRYQVGLRSRARRRTDLCAKIHEKSAANGTNATAPLSQIQRKMPPACQTPPQLWLIGRRSSMLEGSTIKGDIYRHRSLPV
jgi:hypothetical protein